MFLFPGIVENFQDQKGNHFLVRNPQEFLACFSSNIIARILRILVQINAKEFSGNMILANAREIPGFSWQIRTGDFVLL